MPKKLDAKEARFVCEYLVDLDPKRAAVEAGYSKSVAASKAYQWVSNGKVKPHVFEAIQKAMKSRSERTEITQDMVLKELANIAFTDIRNAVRWGKSPIDTKSENADPNGLGMYPVELVPSEKIDDDTAAAVSEVSLTKSGVKIKMHDKKAALDSIGKHLGMFPTKVEHSGRDGGPIEVKTIDASKLSEQALIEMMDAIDTSGSEGD